jgi:hypothetical protein
MAVSMLLPVQKVADFRKVSHFPREYRFKEVTFRPIIKQEKNSIRRKSPYLASITTNSKKLHMYQ